MITLISGRGYTLEVIKDGVQIKNVPCSHWLEVAGGKGGKFIYNNYPCYAPFTGIKNRSSLYIGLCHPNPITDASYNIGIEKFLDIKEGYDRWLEWLVTRSPHAEAVVQGQEWGYNRFVEMNVDAVGHLVHHTACALRIHQEHEYVPLYWMLYTHAGLEEDAAYLMALLTSVRNRSRLIPSVLVSHSAISSSMNRCLAGFLLREYDKELPTWRECAKYAGHGSMWTDGRAGDGGHFPIKSLFPPGKRGNGPWDDPAPGSYPLTPEGVAEFVEKVRDELPRILKVKLIANPKPNGEKYEKA